MASIRIIDEPAFVLHSIPYKETSLILDVFTRQHGRMALIAKGSKTAAFGIATCLATFSTPVGVMEWAL